MFHVFQQPPSAVPLVLPGFLLILVEIQPLCSTPKSTPSSSSFFFSSFSSSFSSSSSSSFPYFLISIPFYSNSNARFYPTFVISLCYFQIYPSRSPSNQSRCYSITPSNCSSFPISPSITVIFSPPPPSLILFPILPPYSFS